MASGDASIRDIEKILGKEAKGLLDHR